MTTLKLRMVVDFMLLSGVRKSELIGANRKELDWGRAT